MSSETFLREEAEHLLVPLPVQHGRTD